MADIQNQINNGNADGARSTGRGAKFLTKGNVGFGLLSVPLNMAAGDDAGTAVLRAGAETALWYTAPAIMGIHMAATMTPQAVGAVNQWHRGKVNQWQKAHLRGQVGGNYQDSQRAMTMRQAAVEAIQGSKLNARSALGGEARILSAGWTRPS
jgi:hypothetical protein